MRRYIFSGLALALVASTLAGCSGSGGDASDYVVPDIPGSAAIDKTVEYTVPNFVSGDNCRVVVSTAHKDPYSTEYQKVLVKADVTYSGAASLGRTDKEEVAALPQAGLACGFCQALEDIDAESFDAALQAGKESTTVGRVGPSSWDDVVVGVPDAVRELYTAMRNEAGEAQKVQVGKIYNGEHCNILSYCIPSPVAPTKWVPAIDASVGENIAKVFDSYNPSDPDGLGIYERITSTFGHEWTANGGRDGDTKINIVLLGPAHMSASVGGLVSPADMLPTVSEDNPYANPNYGNGGEYLYINYEGLVGSEGQPEYDWRTLYGVIAHEFTHLTQCNQKVAHDGKFQGVPVQGILQSEEQTPGALLTAMLGDKPVYEGLAETATNFCGFGVRWAQFGDEARPEKTAELNSLNQIRAYLVGQSLVASDQEAIEAGEAVATTFPTPFFSQVSNPYGYGHLFGLHVLNFYGEEKFKKLYTDPRVGMELLEGVLGATKEEIFHHYDMSVVLAGAELPAELQAQYSKYAIPYINIGGTNFYSTGIGAAAQISSAEVTRAQPAYELYPLADFTTYEVLPYYNTYVGLMNPYTNKPVKIAVNVPKNASIKVIHEDSTGLIKAIY